MKRLTSKETREKMTDRLRAYQFNADVTITQKQFFDMYDKLLSIEDFLEEHNVENLSDYTKQVRKEVVQEIRELTKDYFYEMLDSEKIILERDFIKVLDQIQGEIKEGENG